MLALVIGAVFTGTVLKWDQEGFEALGHNLEIGKLLGGLGFWFSPKLAGDVSILTRLYVAHVAIIPGLLLALFAQHGMLIRRHGISLQPELEAAGFTPSEPSEPFTHPLRRIAAFGLVLLGLLGRALPRGVGPTPVEGIEVTKPPWMFWAPGDLGGESHGAASAVASVHGAGVPGVVVADRGGMGRAPGTGATATSQGLRRPHQSR